MRPKDDADDYAGLPAADVLPAAVVLRAGPTFTVLQGGDGTIAIRCHLCTSVSHNFDDVSKLYCGRCHRFHLGV